MKKINVQIIQRYRVVITSEREGGYSAICPALPGCCSQGDTLKEVTRNIREAIQCYLESLVIDAPTWRMIERRRVEAKRK